MPRGCWNKILHFKLWIMNCYYYYYYYYKLIRLGNFWNNNYIEYESNGDRNKEKSKYGEKAKPCYIVTDSFIVHVKTDDVYKDIAEDAERKFDTSNYKLRITVMKLSE